MAGWGEDVVHTYDDGVNMIPERSRRWSRGSYTRITEQHTELMCEQCGGLIPEVARALHSDYHRDINGAVDPRKWGGG